MKWLGLALGVLTRLPLEKVFVKPRDKTESLDRFLEELEQQSPATPPQEYVSHPIKRISRSMPTSHETLVELKRRLAKELYKAELDLSNRLRIAGKPCDCLDSKHTVGLEAVAEELIAQEPRNPVYFEIIAWINDNRPKLNPEAIGSGKYDEEYPEMAATFKGFRKKVMGTDDISAMVPDQLEIGLEEAKKLASEEAAKEVERLWTEKR